MTRTVWILAGTFLVLVAVILVMVRDDSGVGTTTTTVDVSTTAPGTTTSTEPPSSTTSTDGTTTTTEGTTTTSTGLEGNWGESPLVVAGFGALGWWNGSEWIQVDEGTALPVSGGETYQVAFLGLQATTTGSGPQEVCEPLLNPGVILDNEALLGDWPGPYGVAISAPWKLTPHIAEQFSDDGTYAGFARELLAERGLDVPQPRIKQLVRFDIEGDGVNEILVVAEQVSPDLFAQPGDYSIVFMRRVVDGEVGNAVLGVSIATDQEGQTPFILSYAVGSVADLSGDGRMEMVLSTAYYEGLGVEVWEHVDDDLGPVLRIFTGCGS